MEDWPTLMPAVAQRLLGNPERKTQQSWRYGRRGSLVVYIAGTRRGTWYSFEQDTGGGVLDLIEWELAADRAAALAWLQAQGLIESKSIVRNARRTPNTHPPIPKHRPNRDAAGRNRTIARQSPPLKMASRIWDLSVKADQTPARSYLASRWTWPPDSIGPDLPATVRYLPRDRAPSPDKAAEWSGLPAAAPGAIVYRLTDPTKEKSPTVQVEALDNQGQQLRQRWRRNVGPKAGRVFELQHGEDGALWLVEGPTDALALYQAGAGSLIRAVMGTGYSLEAVTDPQRRPIIFLTDGDSPGRTSTALWEVARALQDCGRAVKICPLETSDPAGLLRAYLEERASIREHDGKLATAEAEAGAWKDLQAALERGDYPINPDRWELPEPQPCKRKKVLPDGQ